MKKAYIVTEWNGLNYEDFECTNIKVFTSELKAEEFRDKMNKENPFPSYMVRSSKPYSIQEINFED